MKTNCCSLEFIGKAKARSIPAMLRGPQEEWKGKDVKFARLKQGGISIKKPSIVSLGMVFTSCSVSGERKKKTT